MVVQSKSLDEIVSLAKEKENMLASIPAIMPIKKKICPMLLLVLNIECIQF